CRLDSMGHPESGWPSSCPARGHWERKRHFPKWPLLRGAKDKGTGPATCEVQSPCPWCLAGYPLKQSVSAGASLARPFLATVIGWGRIGLLEVGTEPPTAPPRAEVLMRRLLPLFVVLFCVAAPRAADAPPRKIAAVEGVTEYRLANGARVLLFPEPSRPTIT